MSSVHRSRKASRVAGHGLPVDFDRDICANLEAAERREWLVTNGIGGFASGTVAGLVTRRYHALLMAALKPPLGRTLLVTKIDEIAEYGGKTFSLGANRWVGGVIEPRGYEFIQRFHLEGATPVWTFACADALLEKRIWMEQGANTTYVTYKLVRATHPLRLALKVLVNYRDFHSSTRAGDWHMDVHPAEQGLRVIAFPGATSFYLLSPKAVAYPTHNWYRDYDHAMERFRGLDDREDNLHAATFGASIDQGSEMTLVLSTEPAPDLNARQALDRRLNYEHSLVDQWNATHPTLAAAAPPWVRQLLFAADQFIVRRPLAQNTETRTVIAGYHWFGDWGRDTMVALPGLALATGRADVARNILQTFAQLTDQGMLPNTFPEDGKPPQYNTVDAALWYIEAVRQYVTVTHDLTTLRELFPVLVGIITHYAQGTRFNIHADPEDGLLYAGERGVALTWMDARVDDWVVTPRIGKPVEVNALWFNALLTMSHFAASLKKPSGDYASMAARAHESFQRFWNDEAQCCFDILDGPEGNDASFRPNQIFAVSLAERLLPPGRMRAVVDACEHHLLTPRGLRSLSPDDLQYRGRCAGPPHDRDAAYHQGTAWGWLLGPFVLARLRVYKDRARAASLLEMLARSMTEYGLGSVAEIFDGDAPFAPRGCIAQAWTVGELLRAWTEIHKSKRETGK